MLAAKDILFRVCFSAAAALLFVWGILSIFAQGTLNKFMEWYTRADKWSVRSGATPKVGSSSQRVIGVSAAVLGMWMALIVLGGLRYRSSSAPTVPPMQTPGGNEWLTLLCATAVIGFGVYLVLRPDTLLRLAIKNLPGRTVSSDEFAKSLQAGRIVGALMVAAGAYFLSLWYKWTH